MVAVLDCEVLGMRDTVEFLVDTGASRTTIRDKDVIRLGIDFSKLEKLSEGMLGIGGLVDTYVLRNVKLAFRREDEESHVENFDRICILKHAVLDEKIMRIPSILGRDMLNKHVFVYDKRQEKAYITDENIR